MPFQELHNYLASIGDSIVTSVRERVGATLTTRNGLTYVCCSDSIRMQGNAWLRNYIWVRV